MSERIKCPACGADEWHAAAKVRGTGETIYMCQLSRVIYADDGSYTLVPALEPKKGRAAD